MNLLIPQLSRAETPFEAQHNQYYVFSGGGYPSLLHVHLPNTIRDINEIGTFQYLVICLDADEVSVAERKQEVLDHIQETKVPLNPSTQPVVIVQNRCFETWFLGNRKLFKRNPESPRLRSFINYFDVSRQDPEKMGAFTFDYHSPFHFAYLKELFSERKVAYTKRDPRAVMEHAFLQELIFRHTETKQLDTFDDFLQFCRLINPQLSAS
ncbi:MAG: hypothetical protein AAF399_09135 [Bacteroidota bacterium]